MANPPGRLVVSVKTKSSDNRWWGPWPNGDKPAGGATLAGAAANTSSAAAALAGTSGAPLVLRIDTPNGVPFGGAGTTGDENGLGGYVSIYGNGFYPGTAATASGLGTTVKVFFGSQEAGNYRFMGMSKSGAALVADGIPVTPVQHIIVQAGALGALVNGTDYPVTVVVNGVSSNTNVIIRPQPGTINWIDTVNGSDSGSHVGMAQPWKTPQTVFLTGPQTGEISGGLVQSSVQTPGCQNVFRTGTYSTTAKDSMLMRFFKITGLPPTGAVGTGGLHVTVYPGPILGNAYEDVLLFRPSGASCIGLNDSARGFDNASPTGMGWAWGVTISNFRMSHDPSAVDGPVNVGANSNRNSVCNCELGPWQATGNSKAGGIAGNGTGNVWFGNHIHDINSNTGESHGCYVDGSNVTLATNVGIAGHDTDISYNYIHDITGGSGLQTYGVASNGHDVITGSNLHHNVINRTSKYGINFADVTQSGIAHNNLIMNTGNQALRTNTQGGGPPAISFLYNTCFNAMAASSGGTNSFYGNEANMSSGYVELIGNLFIMGPARSNTGLTWIANSAAVSAGVIQSSGNMGFDPQGHNTSFTGNLYADPKVVTQWTDFRLQAGSPAINAGAVSTHFTVTTDLNNNARPKPGNANSTIGAYEAT